MPSASAALWMLVPLLPPLLNFIYVHDGVGNKGGWTGEKMTEW